MKEYEFIEIDFILGLLKPNSKKIFNEIILAKKNNPNIKVKKFDISNHSRIEEFIEDVALEMGGLDVLINNAGINVDNLSLYSSSYFNKCGCIPTAFNTLP